MGRQRKKVKLPNYPVRVTIESMAHDGRGIAHVDGKAVFVDGALAGEEVSFLYTGRARKYDEGRLCEIFSASPERVEPDCPHFDICGGCALQHLAEERQIYTKQQILLHNLERIGGVQPQRVLAPLVGPAWGYRHKARLGARFVKKKGRVLVGFREKRMPYLADIRRCAVLHPSVGERISELANLIQSLQARERIAQIEMAVADAASVLVFRNLDPLCEADRLALSRYAQATGLHIYLQPQGPDSIELLWPDSSQLSYRLPDYAADIYFLPTDFTQVNPTINQAMIRQALALLELDASSRVLDLFCGLGNFTLPLARGAARVVGVEGEADLVARAKYNALQSGINNTEYYSVNLSEDLSGQSWLQHDYDRVLLDPPRGGAREVIAALRDVGAARIVYVSCHPGSLARDAGVLVRDLGYRLDAAGVMDMFPHTAHVESMALFVKDR